ncbi:Glycine cleavage system H protein, mitochondrial [Hondaea fermentalgiana]|uniref:Glycine cleavage system H protein n=1 Tax=Hondaea fermentalgiana TaxID=2315210 RepID=A0A2R5FYQ1_9STRA|nr:Glycine cleavage system H protein, mitochondrial [Hondaea fermentalgiana]|eukprot:GBG23877.1 Glycine cleavage system H protein, mitochondrial [Hondaea fermentalgiana]
MSTYKYLESHEYVRVEDGQAVIGISDFAQTQLGDVVYVDLPSVGDTFDKGDSFGSVESVKAASDVYAPVSGKVLEVNELLSDKPELVNTDAMTDAWFIKMDMSDSSELDSLLDEEAYKKFTDE